MDSDGDDPVAVHRITESWTELGVTWDTQPGFDSASNGTFTPDDQDVYAQVDVRELVEEWVSGTHPNYGISLQSLADEAKFSSREESGEEPFLLINAQVPGGGNPSATFSQSLAMAENFQMPTGGALDVIAYVQAASGGGNTTISQRVSSGDDDAEEDGDDGDMYVGSTDLELGYDTSFGDLKVGVRMDGLAIPQGATITNAYLTFRATSPDGSNPSNSSSTTLVIQGQGADNASAFSSSSNDISSRADHSSFSVLESRFMDVWFRL